MTRVLILLHLFIFSSVFSDVNRSTIPVVNLQDYFDEAKQESFIEEVKEALHTVGFFAVTNTGVTKDILDDFYGSAKDFFSFNIEQKLLIDSSDTNAQRGYTSLGKVSAKGATVCDLKEYFAMGREVTEEEAIKSGTWPNKWPDFIDLEVPARAFYAHLEYFSVLFQEIFSLALGEEKDFLAKICKNGTSSCRMIHYPLNTKKKVGDDRTIWAGAHTDVNLFTILPRATEKGLEVFSRTGHWEPVYVDQDAFIVNAGDFLEIFSNGHFRSSIHRVLEPEDMTKDRYSSVFFTHPRAYESLYPLDRWIKDTGGVKKFIKATRMEMLMERMADNGLASNQMLKDLAESHVLERLMTVDRASPEAMKAVYDAGYANDAVTEKLRELKKID